MDPYQAHDYECINAGLYRIFAEKCIQPRVTSLSNQVEWYITTIERRYLLDFDAAIRSDPYFHNFLLYRTFLTSLQERTSIFLRMTEHPTPGEIIVAARDEYRSFYDSVRDEFFKIEHQVFSILREM